MFEPISLGVGLANTALTFWSGLDERRKQRREARRLKNEMLGIDRKQAINNMEKNAFQSNSMSDFNMAKNADMADRLSNRLMQGLEGYRAYGRSLDEQKLQYQGLLSQVKQNTPSIGEVALGSGMSLAQGLSNSYNQNIMDDYMTKANSLLGSTSNSTNSTGSTSFGISNEYAKTIDTPKFDNVQYNFNTPPVQQPLMDQTLLNNRKEIGKIFMNIGILDPTGRR